MKNQWTLEVLEDGAWHAASRHDAYGAGTQELSRLREAGFRLGENVRLHWTGNCEACA